MYECRESEVKGDAKASVHVCGLQGYNSHLGFKVETESRPSTRFDG